MTCTWKLEQFKATTVKENMDAEKFVVPIYQRGVVWSEAQKLDLFDSIRKGMPFGSLLLFQESDGTPYRIIDGLQRTTAIKSIIENPASFFSKEDDIDDNVMNYIADSIIKVEDIPESAKENVKEYLVDLLIKWVQTHKDMGAIENMQYFSFGLEISQKYGKCGTQEIADYASKIEPMLKKFKDLCRTVNDTMIPAIVMQGGEELLPDMFERINSKGTHLSKYQIFAAMWCDYKFVMDAEHIDLVKYNCERYDDMLEEHTVLEGYSSVTFKNAKKLNTFELAFGFGKYLKAKWPHLFGVKDVCTIDSLGFTLLNACVGAKHSEMKNLSINMRDVIGDKNINLFLQKIIAAVVEADNIIGKYSKFKLNGKKSDVIRPLHTENQIISIITAIFMLRHAVYNAGNSKIVQFNLTNEQDNWKYNKKKFEKNLGKIYIQEILQRRWGNSGDKRLDQIILNPYYYARDMKKDDFEKVLDTFVTTTNSERNESLRIAAPKEPEFVFLVAIYINIFSANSQMNDSKYDIEHLATQKKMKEHLKKFPGLRLPISSIANLCLLPQYVNRSKKEMSLYADTDYIKNSGFSIAEIENKFSFTEKSDLTWLDKDFSNAEDLKKAYMDFLDKHFKAMKSKLLANYDSL